MVFGLIAWSTFKLISETFLDVNFWNHKIVFSLIIGAVFDINLVHNLRGWATHLVDINLELHSIIWLTLLSLCYLSNTALELNFNIASFNIPNSFLPQQYYVIDFNAFLLKFFCRRFSFGKCFFKSFNNILLWFFFQI